MNLQPRLLTIAGMVPVDAVVADIGTDHAYLPLYLVQQHIASRVIAGEIHDGPFCYAQQAVSGAGLSNKIHVRRGDGLSVLSPGETDVAVLAGMGATTMIDILTANPDVADSISMYIFQPMVGVDRLRRWLYAHSYRIVAEQLVEDDHILYEIVCAQPGQERPVDDIFYLIGPRLWQDKHPLLASHLQKLIEQRRRLLDQMKHSCTAQKSEKYRIAQREIEKLEELRECL